MDRLLRNDLTIKVLSVLLALALWFMATGEQGQVQDSLSVNVGVRNLGGDLSLTAVTPNKVTVTVRADRARIEQVDDSSVDAFVNLTGSRPGHFGIDVQVSVPVGVTLVGVEPDMVEVSLEAMVEKDVPVNIVVEDQPASGYEIKDIIPELKTVRLRGPESQIARAAAAVGKVSVGGATDDVDSEVTVFAEDDKGDRLNQTVAIPASLDVSVGIREERVEKVVAVEPRVVDTPADGYTVGDVTVDPDTVRVVGAKSVIDKLESVRTEEVSVQDATETVTQTVLLQLPYGVDRAAPSNVDVTIQISKE